MEKDTTIPSRLAPANFDQTPKRQPSVHPIFLIMLAAVILLFVIVMVKRY